MKRLFLFLILVILLSCTAGKDSAPYKYQQPVKLDDGLNTLSLKKYNADMSIMDDAIKQIEKNSFGEIHSVLVAYENNLFIEEYFPGKAFNGGYTKFDINTPHSLASVTKSITSILIGIAVDKGFIKNIDDSILNYYPDYDKDDKEVKSAITIRHLLTMTAGLEWDEQSFSYESLSNDIVRFSRHEDPIAFVLDRPIKDPAGEVFNYCGGCTNLLGDIIFRSSGLKADVFAEKYLFGPLGINSAAWVKKSNETIFMSGDIKLLPRDLFKLGVLFLNQGVWQGKRIVSENWISESTAMHINFDDNSTNGYGFQWWIQTKPDFVYAASGWGDQLLAVVPDKKMVYVITAGNYNHEGRHIRLIKEYLVPLIKTADVPDSQ